MTQNFIAFMLVNVCGGFLRKVTTARRSNAIHDGITKHRYTMTIIAFTDLANAHLGVGAL